MWRRVQLCPGEGLKRGSESETKKGTQKKKKKKKQKKVGRTTPSPPKTSPRVLHILSRCPPAPAKTCCSASHTASYAHRTCTADTTLGTAEARTTTKTTPLTPLSKNFSLSSTSLLNATLPVTHNQQSCGRGAVSAGVASRTHRRHPCLSETIHEVRRA